MKAAQVFPTILIILDICASALYLADGDWKRCVYWIAAGVLTAMVTY